MPDTPTIPDPAVYRIAQGAAVDLGARSTNENGGLDKATGVAVTAELRTELARLQFMLHADRSQRLLVVLQAMDAGGKDGTIRKVFRGVNPQGVRVTSFKAPSAEELSRDYLWRIHDHVPGDGEIAVFNRSHYEDVLVVRVLGLVPEERWRPRYGHIRDFERMLTDEGTTVVKFYLHISPDEQADRLQERLDDPTRNWKFNPGDLDHRRLWSSYMSAFEDAISETSTARAPWYVVPADRKWYRDMIVANVLVDALTAMGLSFPRSADDLEGITIPPAG